MDKKTLSESDIGDKFIRPAMSVARQGDARYGDDPRDQETTY
jgi:hypothetical protein